MDSTRAEHELLRRGILWLLLTSVPMLAFSIWVAVLSRSLSVVAVILDSVVAQSLNLVSYFVLGIVSRQNVFKFPYGTGKLESFAGFLYGCSILLVSGAIVYQGIVRVSNPAVQVSLGLAQVAVVVGLIRISWFVWWISRLVRRNPERSPLLHAYYVNCTGVMWYTTGILVAMLLGWALAGRWGNAVALVIDLLIAASYVVYLLLSGIQVMRTNFRALLDLPLPEADQLKILRVLAAHYDDYANLTNVLTRHSGAERRIEIELAFSPDTTVGQIETIRSRMQDDLARHFGKLEFSLIARSQGT